MVKKEFDYLSQAQIDKFRDVSTCYESRNNLKNLIENQYSLQLLKKPKVPLPRHSLRPSHRIKKSVERLTNLRTEHNRVVQTYRAEAPSFVAQVSKWQTKDAYFQIKKNLELSTVYSNKKQEINNYMMFD